MGRRMLAPATPFSAVILVLCSATSALCAPEKASSFPVQSVQVALSAAGLGANKPPTREAIVQTIEMAESQLLSGRRAEAIAVLASLVESSYFETWRGRETGRAATFLLGKALGESGADAGAREVLGRLLADTQRDTWFFRTVSLWVEFAQASSKPQMWLPAVSEITATGSRAAMGDLAYLRGVVLEWQGDGQAALAQFEKVGEQSRFWAAARYRSGLVHTGAGRLPHAEQVFCQVAAPEQTPRLAPVTGGRNFFEVRDLSRLALGRLAHEQYRFDDARYYYHQVPGDSRHLAEALYEAATSRYEAKDYESAHRLLGELRQLERAHAYEDEAWILEAYVNLARCQFSPADALLQEFTRRYSPVLSELERLSQDPPALRLLMSAVESGSVDKLSLLGISMPVAQRIASMIRVDPAYEGVTRDLALAFNQVAELSAVRTVVSHLQQRVSAGEGSVERPIEPPAQRRVGKLKAVAAQMQAIRRLMRELSASPRASVAELSAAKRKLAQLQQALQLQLDAQSQVSPNQSVGSADPLAAVLVENQKQVNSLRQSALSLRNDLSARQAQLSQKALIRIKLRLTRLMRRARAGRIETVLGAKSSVEQEIEALSQGLLPRGAIDSLDVAQFLQDDEEYWPLDGEDWADEYIGGEGL